MKKMLIYYVCNKYLVISIYIVKFVGSYIILIMTVVSS